MSKDGSSKRERVVASERGQTGESTSHPDSHWRVFMLKQAHKQALHHAHSRIVSSDLMGPCPRTPTGKRLILVVSDTFSRWTEVYPVFGLSACTIAQTLETELYPRWGYPQNVLTDVGSKFTGEFASRGDLDARTAKNGIERQQHREVELAAGIAVQEKYIAIWVPATTRAPHWMVAGDKVYVRDHRLSKSTKEFGEGFTPKWSGLHKIIKQLGYTTLHASL
ncbi:hypothetical protein PR048_019701 [Dryococelus australis]|uniref:Integrase catalytic domain-containing protein n=1 Tax=Dryococelus australis TaxID=614101 RepID=A0ABQ9H484_9NEOP|nr:hypothetical protein PR048_019701 [Dryococelus australis]